MSAKEKEKMKIKRNITQLVEYKGCYFVRAESGDLVGWSETDEEGHTKTIYSKDQSDVLEDIYQKTFN